MKKGDVRDAPNLSRCLSTPIREGTERLVATVGPHVAREGTERLEAPVAAQDVEIVKLLRSWMLR